MARIRENVSRRFLPYVLYMGVPALILVGLLLFFNDWRFGSPIETGYSQWQPAGRSQKFFSLESPLMRPLVMIPGYFVHKGNRNAFLHNPLFFFALFGFYRFWKKNRAESGFFFGSTGLCIGTMCFYWNFGDWCYGPRHLLLWVMIGAVPIVETVEWLLTSARRAVAWPVMAAMAFVMLWSLQMQLYMNHLHYFVHYYVGPIIGQFKELKLQPPARETFHRAYLHADIMAHCRGTRRFWMLEQIEPRIAPQHRAQVMRQLDRALREMGKSNYYFFE